MKTGNHNAKRKGISLIKIDAKHLTWETVRGKGECNVSTHRLIESKQKV